MMNHISSCLKNESGPIIAASDYMKLLPEFGTACEWNDFFRNRWFWEK